MAYFDDTERYKNVYLSAGYKVIVTSAEKEDDIENKKSFIDKKMRFDNKYLKMKKIIKISTDLNNAEETLSIFIDKINEKDLKLFM